MGVPLKKTDSVFVAGEWVKPKGEPTPVFNPATEEVIGLAPTSGLKEVDEAIGAAREAFDKGPWPRLSPAERAAKVGQFHEALMARRADVMRLLVDEVGAVAPIRSLQFDFPMHLTRDMIEIGSKNRDTPLLPGRAPDSLGGKSLVGGVIRREPVGVIAAITPYNFPYLLNLVKVIPALVDGNTVVLKPSPFTPYSALILGEAAAAVGLPRGVLSIVTGDKEVGEVLTTDPRVDLITFTGSDVVGSAIMAQGAATLKRVHFELGGKSAHIVRHDADLEGAAAWGMGYLNHSGQGCGNVTRHLVHNSVRKHYVQILKAAHEALKVGDPADDSVTFGPLIRESQRARTEYFVDQGHKSGAALVTGGRRPAAFPKGYFYEPTLFDNVDNKSPLAQEEVFGPIGAVIGFDTDAEAVEIANESKFGLGGSVWSNDSGAAFEMACAVRAGVLFVNGGGLAPGSRIPPFGGFKRSGIGREWGQDGLDAFTELKSITFRS